MTKSPSNLTNERVREIFTEFYNKWFLPYSKKAVITYHDLDTMYDRGKELLERYPEKMAADLFVDLFEVIQDRRTELHGQKRRPAPGGKGSKNNPDVYGRTASGA